MNKFSQSQIAWTAVIVLTIIPVLFWATMLPIQTRFLTPAISIGSVGKVTGLVAIVLYCMSLVLSTRWKFVERLFGGLNKAYIAHHLVGGVALSLALIHPVALSIRLAESSFREAALQLLPNFADLAITLGVLGLWLFIGLMVVTFFIKLPYNIWLLTHKFMGLAFLLIALHVLLISSDTSQNFLLSSYIIIWLVLGAIAYTYRTLLPRFLVRRYEYVIEDAGVISKDVARFILKPKRTPIEYKSGQFVFVSFHDKGLSDEWHPFTVSSNAGFPGLVLTVKGLGGYTKALVERAVDLKGKSVTVEGAYGAFSFRNFPAKKQVWIAGGIGVTPFLAMLPDVAEDYTVDFYYSVKTPDEMIDYQSIIGVAIEKRTNVRFFPIVTDKDGFLNADKVLAASGDLKQAEILICGPPPMMHALTEQFMKKGLNKRRIHTEEFSIS